MTTTKRLFSATTGSILSLAVLITFGFTTVSYAEPLPATAVHVKSAR